MNPIVDPFDQGQKPQGIIDPFDKPEQDSPKRNWKQTASDIYSPVLELGGMMAGGAIGTPAGGPLGGVAGGALGYAMGSRAADVLDLALGLEEPKSVTENLKDAGKDVVSGAAMEMGGGIAGKAIGAGLAGAGKVGSKALGKLTGAGPGAIEEAAKATPAFRNALRGKVSGEEIVSNARDALFNVKQARGAAYKEQLTKISKNQDPIDMAPIRSKLDDLMEQYNVKTDPNTGKIDVSRIAMNKKGRRDVLGVIKTISEWNRAGDDTAVGLDTLKRQLDDFYSESSQARAFVQGIRNTVRETITKSVPEYAEMTKGYAEMTKIIKDFESGLMLRKQGMTGRIVADQTLRRLMSAMRENSGLRKELLDMLGSHGGKELSQEVAGYTLSGLMPLGLAGTGPALIGEAALGKLVSPAFWPAMMMSSPRVAGEFVQFMGRAAAELSGTAPMVGRALGYGAGNLFGDDTDNSTVKKKVATSQESPEKSGIDARREEILSQLSPEQREAFLKDEEGIEPPAIDPVTTALTVGPMGAVGGIKAGMKLGPAILKGAYQGALAGATDVPVGMAMEKAEEIHPALGAAAGLVAGVAAGKFIEDPATKLLSSTAGILRPSLINRAKETGQLSELATGVADTLHRLDNVDRKIEGVLSKWWRPAGWRRSNMQEINRVLDANPSVKKELQAIQNETGVKMLDDSGKLLPAHPMEELHKGADTPSRTVTIGRYEQVKNKKTGKWERKLVKRQVNKPTWGEAMESPDKPVFGGLKRSITQTYLDNMPIQQREEFRSGLVKTMEDAYKTGDKAELNKSLDAVGGSMSRDKRFPVPSAVRSADKTVGAINFNSVCPMLNVGGHGCYFDGCYVSQIGKGGNQMNFYKSAMYTGEILQLDKKTIKQLNGLGGLRINGTGDTSLEDLAQWRDVFRHAEMRGLKLKVISKQDDTFKVIDKLQKEGLQAAKDIVVQPSIDPYWIPVKEDIIPGSGAEVYGLDKAKPKSAVNAYKKIFGRDAKIINGKVHRKYGWSWEQIQEVSRKYPNINIQPRVLVSTPKEIAEYALKMPEVLQTWMHAKIRPGMYSDIEGKVLDNKIAGNFTNQIAVKKVNGNWKILAQAKKGTNKTASLKTYVQVEDYIKRNYTKEQQEKIFSTLAGQQKKSPSALCCSIGASKDACMTCTSHCHTGSHHSGTDLGTIADRGKKLPNPK